MKSIQIGNNHFLHVYLIKIVHDGMDALWEDDSAELEEGFDPATHRDMDVRYTQSAQDLIEAMGDRHCAHTMAIFTEVFAKELVKHWEKFSSKRLEEPQYKCFVDFLEAREKAASDKLGR